MAWGIELALLDKIKTNRAAAFCLAALSFIFIWSASALLKPYARTPGHTVELNLNCVPDQVGVELGIERSRVLKAEMTIDFIDELGRVVHQPVPPTDMRVVPNVKNVTLMSTEGIWDQLLAANANRVATKIVIFLRKEPFVDIVSVQLRAPPTKVAGSCKLERFEGRNLLSVIPPETGARIFRFNLIQERLSDYLLVFNTSLGNIALMILCSVLLWTIWRVFEATVQRWRVRGKRTLSAGPLVFEEISFADASQLQEQLENHYWHQCWWPNFWKIAGPAAGFVLTVSSLAASLHPTVQATKDAYAFIAGIQIAVISTFVGLCIRLFAHIDTSIRLSTIYRVADVFSNHQPNAADEHTA